MKTIKKKILQLFRNSDKYLDIYVFTFYKLLLITSNIYMQLKHWQHNPQKTQFLHIHIR